MTKWLLSQSRKLTSVCTEDVDCTDNAQQIFWRENHKCLLWLEWSASVLCSLFSLLTGDVVSEMKLHRLRKLPPLVTGFYDLQPTI